MSPPIQFNPAAEALFRLSGPTAVSAGAGSGKTTALVELCLRLFSGAATGAPCEPWEVGAITFTEKAAEELVERLRQAVQGRVDAESEASGPEARAWIERLNGLDRMALGTIHGFAGRLLREHALEAGIDPEFKVAEQESADAWRREASRSAVVAAIDAGRPGALALCAGLGASGPAGLDRLVARLVADRATLGMQGLPESAPDRLDEALAARRYVLEVADDLLRAAPRASGLDPLRAALARFGPEVREGPLSPAGLATLAGLPGEISSWRPKKSDGEGLPERKKQLAAAAEAFVELAAEALAGPQKQELATLVAEAERGYARRKEAERALDFDDLLTRTRDLLVRDAGLRGELRGRFRALLVDEYQDVNGLQQEIFDLIAPVGSAGPGPVRVAVGDLKQSIYRFRGADVAVFARFVDQLESTTPERVLRLTENYRSAPAILDLVNAVFAGCMRPAEEPARPYELRFTDGDRLLARRAEGLRPACELLEDGEPGKAAERRAREAQAIAARIAAIVSGRAGVTVRERGPDGGERARAPRYGDVAVLFRRLTQIGVYESALRAAGIPYHLARGGGFYQAPEVRDLGELLATLADPEDAVAWAAVLRSPLCGVSDGTLFILAQRDLRALARRDPAEVAADVREAWSATAGARSAHQAVPLDLGLLPSELARLDRFLRTWRDLSAVRDRVAVPELLQRAADALDLEPALLASPEGERRLVNHRKAIALARRFADEGGDAVGYAERLRLLAASPPREPEGELEVEDAVALLSVHQAKGLEWPVVFVPDLAARPPPESRRALFDGGNRLCASFFDSATERFHKTASQNQAQADLARAGVAESQRLLYVALTRARDYLIVSGEAGQGSGKGTWRHFVEAAAEAHPELLRRVAVAEAGTAAIGPALELPEAVRGNAELAVEPPTLAASDQSPVVKLAVTDLAEYARCPRRHFLSRYLALPERLPVVGKPVQDDPSRATARGTLAHAMLSEVDLAAPPLAQRAQLGAAASRRGYDEASPAVRRILRDVIRFLDSPAGRRLAGLAQRAGLRREVPFLMRLDGLDALGSTADAGGARCYLSGAIDAIAEEKGSLVVIDFKYALPAPGAAEKYRIQLLAYALAATRALPGKPVRASLQYLRGNCASVDVTPSPAELAAFAQEAPRLAAAAALGRGGDSPEALGRTEARCRSEGCGYVFRCYPRRGPERAGAEEDDPEQAA